jgi:hypothetical protein
VPGGPPQQLVHALRQNLPTRWSNAGQTPVKRRSNAGQTPTEKAEHLADAQRRNPCSCSTGQTLPKNWSNTGQSHRHETRPETAAASAADRREIRPGHRPTRLLVKRWSNAGQTLVKHPVRAGLPPRSTLARTIDPPALEACPAGQTLVKRWSNAGQMLAKLLVRRVVRASHGRAVVPIASTRSQSDPREAGKEIRCKSGAHQV